MPLVQQTLSANEWKAFADDQRRRIGQRDQTRLAGFRTGRRQQQQIGTLVLSAGLTAIGSELVNDPGIERLQRVGIGSLYDNHLS